MSTPEKTITLAQSDRLNALPPMRLDPQALIAKALEEKVPVETLERLVQLAKDIRAITAEEAFNKAIAEFQRKCPPIKKTKTGYITDRATYKYADLSEIEPTIAPLCGQLGLSHSWENMPCAPGEVKVNCRISHELGHSRWSGPVTIPYTVSGRMNSGQTVGSALTYAKRYSLTMGLGISPEDDDDAGGTDGRGKTAARAEDPADDVRAPATTSNPVPGRAAGEPATVQPVAPRAPGESGLFDSPPMPIDAVRQQLVLEITEIINRVLKQKKATATDVRSWRKTYLGSEDADVFNADVAALHDLHKYLLGRFGA
jgi:hypothetical protein